MQNVCLLKQIDGKSRVCRKVTICPGDRLYFINLSFVEILLKCHQKKLRHSVCIPMYTLVYHAHVLIYLTCTMALIMAVRTGGGGGRGQLPPPPYFANQKIKSLKIVTFKEMYSDKASTDSSVDLGNYRYT